MGKYTVKKTFVRRKKVYKKKSQPNRSSMRSSMRPSRPLRLADTTVTKLNPGKDRMITVKKSYPINSQGYASAIGFTSPQIVLGTTGFTYGGNLIFDPSGTFGQCTGKIDSASPTLGALPIPEWVSYKALYGLYKVKRMTIKFRADDNGSQGLLSQPPVLYMRYLNEFNQATPTYTSISEEKNWVRKTFTPEHPEFSYSFYPKVMQLVDNAGTLATDTRVPKSMGWTSVNTPVELYGIKFWLSWPGSADTTTLISLDISYDIQFKEQG